MLHKKTLIALAAAVALGCVPVATNALAAGHPGGHGDGGGQTSAGHSGGGGHAFAGRGGGGRAMAGPARGGYAGGYARGGRVVVRSGGGGYYGGGGGYYGGGGPIYDSCSGYGDGYGGCPGYGVPIIGAVIDGVFGGYGGY